MTETKEIDRQAAIVDAVTERLAGPRFVHIVRYDTKHGDSVEVYETQEDAVNALIDFLEDDWAGKHAPKHKREAVVEMVSDLKNGAMSVCGFDDYFTLYCEEVQSRSAKSSPRNDA